MRWPAGRRRSTPPGSGSIDCADDAGVAMTPWFGNPALPRRIGGGGSAWPLHDAAASRRAEAAALAQVPPHTLMQRAGLGVARLARALAPHARRVLVAAGPGNNGGDGLVAARHLHQAGLAVRVHLLADIDQLPADAARAWAAARDAGVPIDAGPPQTDGADLVIDALLGLGGRPALAPQMRAAIEPINRSACPVLAVDLPSGLDPDTGQPRGDLAVRATATLSLLTLKPGLFTGAGRDHAGEVWFDELGADAGHGTARLLGRDDAIAAARPWRHALHKGSFGDMAVVGGAPGMGGAAWLAAAAGLTAGAGRVVLSLLDAAAPFDTGRPELMPRHAWWTAPPPVLAASTVVCGCGGGQAVAAALPALLGHAGRLVLDADALNAIAADPALATLLHARGARARPTVLTPHPLEAARLLGCSVAQVQHDRIAAAMALAARHACVVVLKGSGSVVAAPGAQPCINPTGNAALASAGTGDVLAGWIGGTWASQAATAGARQAACASVWLHGRAADVFTARRGRTAPLRAADLIEAMRDAAGD
jgi:ADP-dependent NAD(P)H-hydrate dehydratase / NAD(P)H-hydrate epimerase